MTMGNLREMKKRLRSINTTEQLSGAMKTVAAAKYSQISAILERYRPYRDAVLQIVDSFGDALTGAMKCGDTASPPCYVVISSNKGLCGGYNTELLAYADRLLEAYGGEYKLVVCGKLAAAYYSLGGHRAEKSFVLPDIPDYSEYCALIDYLTDEYINGGISSVTFIYQSFRNMLTQVPAEHKVLPFSSGKSGSDEYDGTIYIPSRASVLRETCRSCVYATMYSIMIEAAAGAQAATLMAMRAAYDNAAETALDLQMQISRKRQSEVTASVIETSSDNSEMNDFSNNTNGG